MLNPRPRTGVHGERGHFRGEGPLPSLLRAHPCEGLTFNSTDMHEFAYAAFANLAKVMGDELLRVLGELVPHLATVTGQDEERFE